MEIEHAPPAPQYIYKDGILYYTIIDWHYIAPESKASKILNTGWLPLKVFNFEHPLMKKSLAEVHKQQAQCLANKNVDWERLSHFYFTI
jgi:hypothetical protein